MVLVLGMALRGLVLMMMRGKCVVGACVLGARGKCDAMRGECG